MEDRSLQLGKDRLWLRVGEGSWWQGWPRRKRRRRQGEAPEPVNLQIWVCSSYVSDASVACISDLKNLQLWKQKREREQ